MRKLWDRVMVATTSFGGASFLSLHQKLQLNTTVRSANSQKAFERELLRISAGRIVAYCCESMCSRQWREREASCAALEKFMLTLEWTVLRLHIDQLWIRGMNVLDDIRTSTRAAAVGFVKVLSDHMVRACTENNELSAQEVLAPAVAAEGTPSADKDAGNDDEGNTDDAFNSLAYQRNSADIEAAIDIVMRLILEQGVLAPSAEARGVAVGTLVRVVKAAGRSLGKWLVPLISVLVESMSALEPRSLQYMQFHTARLQISDDELENLRIKMSQSSPMHEALDTCLGSLSIETNNCNGAGPSSKTVPLSTTVHSLGTAVAVESSLSSIVSKPASSSSSVQLLSTHGELLQGCSVSAAAYVLSMQLTQGVGLATRTIATDSLAKLVELYPRAFGSDSRESVRCGRSALQALTRMILTAPSMAVSLRKATIAAYGAMTKV